MFRAVMGTGLVAAAAVTLLACAARVSAISSRPVR